MLSKYACMLRQTSRGPDKSGGGVRMGVRKRASLVAQRLSEVGVPTLMPLHSGLKALGGAGHLCSLYKTRQECSDIVKTFVELGIARRERCLCVVSGSSEQSVREGLHAASPRIDRAVAAHAVDLTTIDRAYFSCEGPFTQRALDFWRRAGERAAAEGFSGLRGIVQVDGILGGSPLLARWIEYENRLTQVLGEGGGTMLCLYNCLVQPAEFVRDAFWAHAIVAHRGGIGQNTFHVPLEEYAAPDKVHREVHRMLLSPGGRWRAKALTQKRNRRVSQAPRTVKDCKRVIQALTEELRNHKQNEQSLRRYVNYLTLGQQMTRTGSWAWNWSSGELFWSREHFRIFGLDPKRTKVSYQGFVRMVHPEERVRVEDEFQEAVHARRDFNCEYRIIRPDGSVKHMHSRAQPVFGIARELTGYVGTVADITERRHGEESVGSMQAELARTSHAITLRQLMASIAHEVNQPLAAVIANAHAAVRWLEWEEPQTEKARQALSRIVRDGNRASEIIARIRGLVGKTNPLRAPLSLNSVVHEVLVLLNTELRRGNVTVRTDLTERLAPIQGDRVQIQQVLLNLVMNAIEAMDTVTAWPRRLVIATAGGASGVALSVKDCGTGLAKEQLESIFEPFYSSKPRGMGIGLSISRSIIEAHGGRLWAIRNKAAGTTFKFRLPVAAA